MDLQNGKKKILGKTLNRSYEFFCISDKSAIRIDDVNAIACNENG